MALTQKDLEKHLQDIFYNKEQDGNKFVIHQYCKTKNKIIERTDTNLNLCANPECANCSLYLKIMNVELKNVHK